MESGLYGLDAHAFTPDQSTSSRLLKELTSNIRGGTVSRLATSNFGWSWAQLECLFAVVHEIATEHRPAFNSKLRHLQRVGVLPGTNKGRGRAAAYNAGHVASMGIALEIVQFGLSPEHTADLLVRGEKMIRRHFSRMASDYVINSAELNSGPYLIFSPQRLSYLQMATGAERCVRCLESFEQIEAFLAVGLAEQFSGRAAIIDLRSLLRSIASAAMSAGLGNPITVASGFAAMK